MDLLKSFRSDSEESEHWVAIGDSYMPPDLMPLDNFRQKLDRALNELGRVDYSLQESLACLRSDMLDTHDCLHAQITDLAEPELNKAMGELADAIVRSMGVVDDVLAGNRMRKQ
jgi:hypothetical protein